MQACAGSQLQSRSIRAPIGLPISHTNRRHAAHAPCAVAEGSNAVRHAPQPAMRLNLGSDTALAIPFDKQKALDLQKALNTLTETLGAKAKATKPQRWPLMEWTLHSKAELAGGIDEELQQMEVICNPNAHTSIFDARALVSLRTRAGLKVQSEARIPGLQADLDAFLSSS